MNLKTNLIVAFCLFSAISFAQSSLYTTKGVTFPTYTTGSRPAANTVGLGTVLYNTSDNTHQFSNGASWLNLLGTTSVPSGTANQTLRNNGSGWVADGLMQNNGSRVLIGLNNYDSDGLIRVNAGNFSTAIMATSTDYPAITTISTSGVGVSSISTSGSAFIGVSSTADAITGTSTTGRGVYGFSNINNAVEGYSINGRGVNGSSSSGTGVRGESGTSFGVYGISSSETGVNGISTTGKGIHGFSNSNTGVKGESFTGYGVFGVSSTLAGVRGESNDSFGVYGTSNISTGVRGASNSWVGVSGYSGSSYGGLFYGRVRLQKGGNGDAGIEFEKSNGAQGGYVGMNGDNEMMIYGFPYGGAIQRWNVNGGSICYATSPTICSDIRLKKDFRDLSNSLTSITQLKGYNYYLRNERNPNLQTGFIAQEIQKIFPELVNQGSDGYLSVDYTGLIPHLVESVKVLKSENEELKERLLKIENLLNIKELSAKK